jgi:fumarate hydratase subunit alpha
MKSLPYETIVTTVRQLCIECCRQLPDDVLGALKKAQQQETNQQAAKILNQLIENAKIASEQEIPLCQDTGLAVVFVECGGGLKITPPTDNADKTLLEAINDGVAQGYETGLLRKSVVTDPLNQRKNTNTNTPAVIHCQIVPGDKLKITLMAKGGGCENKSRFKMFNPTETKGAVIDWIVGVVKQAGANACPPFIIGVGIGGSFEQCCLISKKALLRQIESHNKDPFYSEMETELLGRINSLGLGPQGLGGDTTALAAHIETAPCHIASLPVAVNIECHAHRHKTAILP